MSPSLEPLGPEFLRQVLRFSVRHSGHGVAVSSVSPEVYASKQIKLDMVSFILQPVQISLL